MKPTLKNRLLWISLLGGLIISGCNALPKEGAIAPSAPAPGEKIQASVNITEKPDVQETAASKDVQQANAKDESSTPAFNAKHPQIIGLAIGESLDKAVEQYGEPLDSYIMEDATEPLSVYQYDGFSIGFNTASQIQFIDISSASINPGLNGLRLGQTSDQALKILGKPDKNTNHVISYNTKTAILKLDIDPKTKTIQSIKLFAVNES